MIKCLRKVVQVKNVAPLSFVRMKSGGETSEAKAPIPNTRIEKTLNQVMLLGRVGADPQKRGNAEHPVVLFSLATHSNYQYDSGEYLQKTDWHRIAVFKPYLRDTVYKYMTKGQRVLVQGRITYGEVKDENGNTVLATSILADDVTFFPKGSKDEL